MRTGSKHIVRDAVNSHLPPRPAAFIEVFFDFDADDLRLVNQVPAGFRFADRRLHQNGPTPLLVDADFWREHCAQQAALIERQEIERQRRAKAEEERRRKARAERAEAARGA